MPLRLLLFIRRQPVTKVNLLHHPQIFNPFHATDLFLYPLKNQKTTGLLIFSGDMERNQLQTFEQEALSVETIAMICSTLASL